MTEQQVVPTRLKAEVDALVERLLEASKNNELSLPVSSPENRRHTLLTMISNYCTNILRSNPRKCTSFTEIFLTINKENQAFYGWLL